MNDWIEWHYTPEKPYPETLDTELSMVRFRDGQEYCTNWTVEIWHGTGKTNTSNWANTGNESEIVAYKVVRNDQV